MELIDDLLDVTKIEVGKFMYKKELFDFDELVVEIVNHQRIINKERVISVSGRSNKIIRGDRYRIGQVITNLLTNAVKYSPEKSPIEVRIKRDRERIILAVKDYGIGIPRSEQRAVFNQFYRSRSTQKGKAEGLGLGLFISSQIIKHHRGKLGVKSSGSKGSVFFLEMPILLLNDISESSD